MRLSNSLFRLDRFAVIFYFCLWLPLGATTVAISNLDQTPTSNVAVGKQSGFNFQEAGSFTTGGTAYSLDSISLDIVLASVSASDFTLSLYTGMSTAGPTGLVATLVGSSHPTVGINEYDADAAIMLLSSSTYWIVASAPDTAVGTGFGVRSTTSTSEDAGGLADWTIGDTRWLTNNGGTTWSQGASGALLEFSVNVTSSSVPDGGMTSVLFGIALVGLFVLRRKFASA